MANENRYYKTPFAESGNKAEIPDVSTSGEVGYDTGYGPDYELAQGSASRKRIERDLYNGMFNGITGNLKQWQENLYPTWIEDNGFGAAFPYDEGMIVNHEGVNYISFEDSNQEEPSTGSKWAVYDATLKNKNYLGVKTLAEAVADATVYDGAYVYIKERCCNYIYTTGLTSNDIDIFESTGVTGLFLQAEVKDEMSWENFGITFSGDDESEAAQRAIDVAKKITGNGKSSDAIALSTGLITTQENEICNTNFKALEVMESIIDATVKANIHDNNFNGDSKAELAVRSRDNIKFKSNSVSNITSSSANLASGIYATLTNKNKGSVIIRGNDVDGVEHTTTGGTIGSNDGSSRAIVVKLFGTCTRCFTAIDDNICIDIYGREGDSIATSDENWGGNNLFSVKENNILGFNRRGVKVQSSNTAVSGNNIEDIAPTDARAINGKNSIEIASDAAFNVTITDNSIDCLSLEGAINIYQAIKSSVTNNTITVNRTDISGSPSIAIQYGENVNCTINNNEILTNHFIIMVDAGTVSSDQGATVKDNDITCTSLSGVVASSGTVINVTGAETRGIVKGNNIKGDIEALVAATGGKTLTNYRVVRNDIITTAGRGRVVDASGATHVNCLAMNNTSDGTAVPFPTPLDGWKRYGNYHPTFETGVNDQDLLVERGAAIADSTGGDNQTTINAILSELRVKNIIAA